MPLDDILFPLQAHRDSELRRISALKRDLAGCSPEYAALDARIRRMNVQRARGALPGAAPGPTQQDIAAVRREMDELLCRMGITQAELTPRFFCPICQDTGYDATGSLCACVRQKRLEQQLQLGGLDPQATFDAFDSRLFAGKTPKGQPVCDIMERLKARAMDYVADFPHPAVEGWLLLGPVGTGKTFLAQCMAHGVIEKGYTAALAGLMRAVQAMRPGAREQADLLMDCDLLILDDLGAEPMWQNATVETLHALVADRQTRGKGLIVTSNLDLDQIKQRYGERLLSRLTDSRRMQAFKMPGYDDLRQAGPRG